MNKLPRPDALRANRRKRDAAGTFYSQDMARFGGNPWISPSSLPKSLIVYNCSPTGCAWFSTGCIGNLHLFPVFLHKSIFLPFPPISIYLFIYKEEKRRKGLRNRKAVSTCCKRRLFFRPRVPGCIHGLQVEMCCEFISKKQALDAAGMCIHVSTDFFAPPFLDLINFPLGALQ